MTRLEKLDPACRRLTGVIPSQNTPFTADDAVDEASIARLAEASVMAGVSAFLILAVASENRALSIGERARIGAVFSETVAGRVPLIVAVSAPDIATALALTRLAVALKADAVCYQAPAGIAVEALGDHLTRIADLGPPLVMLQDLDFGGPGLPIADIEWLYARCPRFRAIKVETQNAGPKYSELLRVFDGALHVSGGWAVMQMIEALERGVHAFMPTAMDNIYVEIHRLFASNRRDEAATLFEQLLPFVAFSNQHLDVSISFFKRLRQLDGCFTTDACRSPTPELDPFQQATLRRLAPRAVALDQGLARTKSGS